MPKKGIKSLKKPKTPRVALPTDLHLWLKKRAAEKGDYIQDIVAHIIQRYIDIEEQKKD